MMNSMIIYGKLCKIKCKNKPTAAIGFESGEKLSYIVRPSKKKMLLVSPILSQVDSMLPALDRTKIDDVSRARNEQQDKSREKDRLT